MVLVTLSGSPEVRIRYGSNGKPGLLTPGSFISFAHSGCYAAAIISDTTQTGIDLEQVRGKIARVADRFLTEQELSLVSDNQRLEQLTLFWCVKEALYKLRGKPDVDIKYDLRIESFDYLCSREGQLTGTMKAGERIYHVPVTWRKVEDSIIAWALSKHEIIE